MRKPGLLSIHLINSGLILFLLFLLSCANIVAPTGGPKDITPPLVVNAEPDNYNTHFKGNTIRLYFDEYVQLKDESRVMLMSPPSDNLPEARIKGKSVVLTFSDTLKANTTYSIQFGTAIQDYTEGNPLSNYTYVFSTGNVIDSLSISGNVILAVNLTPAAKVMVFLYSSTDDSVIFKEKPRYIARTDDNGQFRIEHIAQGAYKMIALKDGNTDLIASIPAEEIAFPDSLVHPIYLSAKKDTVKKDTVHTGNQLNKEIKLLLFKQKDSTQRFQKAYLEKPQQLILPYTMPVEKMDIKVIGSSADLPSNWYTPEWSKTHDTLTCWINSSVDKDSLNIRVDAGRKNIDTVRLDLKRFGKGGKYRRDKDKIGKLSANLNIGGTVKPDEDIIVTFSYPIVKADLNEVRLIKLKDTLTVKPIFTDSLKRNVSLHYQWEENTSYQLIFPKGILKDWTQKTNDSLLFRFATKPLQDYGNLIFHFKAQDPGQYIVQLLDSKERVIKETSMINSGTWKLNYLNAGTYRIKVVQDKNNNSHWDSGNYYFKIQPEKVAFYPKTLEIRGNWDLEETWEW